jgi:transcriptional regulator with XRE-family HTH domain
MYYRKVDIRVIPVCVFVKLITQYPIHGKRINAMDEADLRSLLSKNIKRFRQRKSWSQAKLAEKMNISTNYLSDIETGRGWVSPFSLVKLANALEVEVYELFKHQEMVSINKVNIVNKCLEDFSSSLRVSFEKSIIDSMRKIQKNL